MGRARPSPPPQVATQQLAHALSPARPGHALAQVSLWSECTHLGGASKTLHFPASALAAAAAANVTLPGGTSSASPNATLPGLRVGFCATAPSTIAVLVITAAAAVLGLLCVAAGVAVCLRRRRRREAAADGDAAQPLSPAPRQRVHPLVAAVAEPHRGVRVRAGPTRRAPAAAAAPSPPSTAASPPQPQPHQRCCCGLLPAAPKLGAFLGLLAAQQATVLLLTSLLFDTAAVLFLSQKVASASLHLVAAALFIVSGGLDGLELRAAGARAARLDAEFGTRLARLQRLRWAAFAGNTTGGVLVVAGSVYALQAAEDYGAGLHRGRGEMRCGTATVSERERA